MNILQAAPFGYVEAFAGWAVFCLSLSLWRRGFAYRIFFLGTALLLIAAGLYFWSLGKPLPSAVAAFVAAVAGFEAVNGPGWKRDAKKSPH